MGRQRIPGQRPHPSGNANQCVVKKLRFESARFDTIRTLRGLVHSLLGQVKQVQSLGYVLR